MDKLHYIEMMENLDRLIQSHKLHDKRIYLFGHCNATEELADILKKWQYQVEAILDNNSAKQGTVYNGIPITAPSEIMNGETDDTIVCIAARAFESMASQLRNMGYVGEIKKLIDYNTYAEYSLSEDTVSRRRQRAERGNERLWFMEKKYPGCYRLLCPFAALGDVYYMMAYLPYYLQKKRIERYVVAVIGETCAEVVKMFGAEHIEVLTQYGMDELIQATLYTEDKNSFIPHQDRPYTVNLAKALYVKMIPLEKIYCCGVFGLKAESMPYKPERLGTYGALHEINKGRAVILAPNAKSVTNIRDQYWIQIIDYYRRKDYQIFTNVVGNDLPLVGTSPLKVPLSEMQSVVEHAGTFIGLRSGLCDIIKEADCRKIAIYPDRYYSDTRWKMAEIYHLEGWENIVVS